MVSTPIKSIYSVINVRKNVSFGYKQILSCKALKFIADLHLNFNSRRLDLLLHNNKISSFNNASSEAKVFLKHFKTGEIAAEFIGKKIKFVTPFELDFFNQHTNGTLSVVNLDQMPVQSWERIIEDQIRLKEIINYKFTEDLESFSETNIIVEKAALFLVQLRPLHLDDENILINKEHVSAALLDFGLFYFHNTKKLIEQGFAPYFYLPNVENKFDVKFWSDVFNYAEDNLGLPKNITQAVN